ncbi:MAG: hypothetical protein LBU62_09330, partial [Bacteroidales bacterium]|nr:hypothetical protein [Bacteroidales bacterium]
MKRILFLMLAIVFLGLLYFVFSAGHSNLIYFDIEQQNIVRCKGSISNLYITSKDNIDNLHFSVLPNKKSCRNFSIKELNKDYLVEVQGGNFDLQNFKLRPETEYEIINHSNGDAADGKLLVRTNKKGMVI